MSTDVAGVGLNAAPSFNAGADPSAALAERLIGENTRFGVVDAEGLAIGALDRPLSELDQADAVRDAIAARLEPEARDAFLAAYQAGRPYQVAQAGPQPAPALNPPLASQPLPQPQPANDNQPGRIPLAGLSRLSVFGALTTLSGDTPQPRTEARLVPGTSDLAILTTAHPYSREVTGARFARVTEAPSHVEVFGFEVGPPIGTEPRYTALDVPVTVQNGQVRYDPIALGQAYGRQVPGWTAQAPEPAPLTPRTGEEEAMIAAMRAAGATHGQIAAELENMRAERAGGADRAAQDSPLRPGEVMTYRTFGARSEANDGLTGDHIPSRAAMVERVESELGRDLTASEADWVLDNTGVVVITEQGHVDLSQTYGGRNTPARIARDAADLHGAADSNLDAVAPDLRSQGLSDAQIVQVRADLHRLNQEVVARINERFGTDIRY